MAMLGVAVTCMCLGGGAKLYESKLKDTNVYLSQAKAISESNLPSNTSVYGHYRGYLDSEAPVVIQDNEIANKFELIAMRKTISELYDNVMTSQGREVITQEKKTISDPGTQYFGKHIRLQGSSAPQNDEGFVSKCEFIDGMQEYLPLRELFSFVDNSGRGGSNQQQTTNVYVNNGNVSTGTGSGAVGTANNEPVKRTRVYAGQITEVTGVQKGAELTAIGNFEVRESKSGFSTSKKLVLKPNRDKVTMVCTDTFDKIVGDKMYASKIAGNIGNTALVGGIALAAYEVLKR